MHEVDGPYWATRGRDARRTSAAAVRGPAVAEVRWRYQTGALPMDGPAMLGGDGTIYVPGGQCMVEAAGVVYALRPDGSLKWEHRPRAAMNGLAQVTDAAVCVDMGDGVLLLEPEHGKEIGSAGSARDTGTAVSPAGVIYTPVGDDGAESCLVALQPDGTELWSLHIGGSLSSPEVGADGTIFLGTFGGGLYAISAGGEVLWHRDLPGARFGYTAAPGGRVLLGSEDGDLSLLGADGTLLWSRHLSGSVVSGPATAPDWRVYVTAGDGTLHALAADGGTLWRFSGGTGVADSGQGTALSLPGLGRDGRVYVGCPDHRLYALDRDGRVVWSFTAGGAIGATPCIGGDGSVYVGSDDGFFYALDAGGRERWRFRSRFGQRVSSPVLVDGDGCVYAACADRRLYAIDRDGGLKWACQPALDGSITAGLAIANDGTIYAHADGDTLVAMGATGAARWSYAIDSWWQGSPLPSPDGGVFVGTDDGQLHALDGDGSLRWSFSTGYAANGMGGAAQARDGSLYFVLEADERHALYALGPDGHLAWTFSPQGEELLGCPAIGEEGSVYVRSRGGRLYAVSPAGLEEWHFPVGQDRFYSDPAIAPDGSIYIGGNAFLHAIHPSGRLKWRFRPPSIKYSQVVSIAIGGDGVAYILVGNSGVYAVSADGAELWSLAIDPVPRTYLALANEVLYLGSQDGHLCAIGGAT